MARARLPKSSSKRPLITRLISKTKKFQVRRKVIIKIWKANFWKVKEFKTYLILRKGMRNLMKNLSSLWFKARLLRGWRSRNSILKAICRMQGVLAALNPIITSRFRQTLTKSFIFQMKKWILRWLLTTEKVSVEYRILVAICGRLLGFWKIKMTSARGGSGAKAMTFTEYRSTKAILPTWSRRLKPKVKTINVFTASLTSNSIFRRYCRISKIWLLWRATSVPTTSARSQSSRQACQG